MSNLSLGLGAALVHLKRLLSLACLTFCASTSMLVYTLVVNSFPFFRMLKSLSCQHIKCWCRRYWEGYCSWWYCFWKCCTSNVDGRVCLCYSFSSHGIIDKLVLFMVFCFLCHLFWLLVARENCILTIDSCLYLITYLPFLLFFLFIFTIFVSFPPVI